MKFEHMGFNVPDAAAMADWYVKHCGMSIAMASEGAPYMRFLADSTGRVCAEIYTNPNAAIPDYASQNPLVFHFAFAVDNARAEKERLMAAGATVVSDGTSEDGTGLVMMRDPWGIPLQLCCRKEPLV